MQKKLTVISFYENIEGDVTDLVLKKGNNSSLASNRLQLFPAIKAANELGMNVKIYSIKKIEEHILRQILETDFCLVGKAPDSPSIAALSANALAVAKILGSKNIPIATIYSDNHIFRENIVGDFYKKVIQYSSHLICPSQTLLNLISPWLDPDTQSIIIEDPWQIPTLVPFEKLSDKIKLIWFGSRSNYLYLIRELKKFYYYHNKTQLPVNIELTILGRKSVIDDFRKRVAQDNPRLPPWIYRLKCWDDKRQPEQFEEELTRANIALLPSDPNDPGKKGISHNRLVDAVRAGCVTLASPMNSYKELAKVSVISSDFPKTLPLLVNQYSRLCLKYEQHREEQLKRFSPRKNIDNWKNLFNN